MIAQASKVLSYLKGKKTFASCKQWPIGLFGRRCLHHILISMFILYGFSPMLLWYKQFTYLLCILQNCNRYAGYVRRKPLWSNSFCKVGGTTSILTNGVPGSRPTNQSQLRWGRGGDRGTSSVDSRLSEGTCVCVFLLCSACVRQLSQLTYRELVLCLFSVWCFEKLDWGVVVTNVS